MPIQNNTGDTNTPDLVPPVKPGQDKNQSSKRDDKRNKEAGREPKR